jgi:hypothetical protein
MSAKVRRGRFFLETRDGNGYIRRDADGSISFAGHQDETR